jgi:hypothetical protein
MYKTEHLIYQDIIHIQYLYQKLKCNHIIKINNDLMALVLKEKAPVVS